VRRDDKDWHIIKATEKTAVRAASGRAAFDADEDALIALFPILALATAVGLAGLAAGLVVAAIRPRCQALPARMAEPAIRMVESLAEGAHVGP
jgi:hypothetical protein